MTISLPCGSGRGARGRGGRRAGDPPEVSGTTSECPMERVGLRYVVRDDLNFDVPRPYPRQLDYLRLQRRPPQRGRHQSTERGMLNLMMRQFGLSREDTRALASPVAGLRGVTQLVNGVCSVHTVLPHGAFQ